MAKLADASYAFGRAFLVTMTVIARHIIGLAGMLLASAAAIFLLLHALPGDPASVMLGLNAPPEAVAALRHQFGLDNTLLAQFTTWLKALLHGDLGQSFAYRVPVLNLVSQRLAVTLPLATLSFCLLLLLGLGLGLFAALRANTLSDKVLRAASLIILSMPSFFMGLLLVLLFSVHLQLLPAGGFAGWEDGIWPSLRSLLLPALALSLAQAAILFRIVRASLRDVLSEPYLRTARMKGLSRWQALRHHALPNTWPAVLTMIGFQATVLLTGSVIIENVFTLPGLGRLLYQGVTQHDIPLVQGLVFLFVAAILSVHFLIDLCLSWADPRVSSGHASR